MVSVVNLDNILIVPRGRLVKRMGVCVIATATK